MQTTSVMDINSTSDGFDCYKPAHVGERERYVATLLCFFVGTPAHSWLLWLSFRDSWKIKPTQVFPLNLIILELIYCSLCAVDVLHEVIFNSEPFWTVMSIMFGLSWVGRPLTQIFICVEQYLAVLHPIIFLKYKGVQYRIVSVAVVWLTAAACAVYESFSDIVSEPAYDAVFFIALAVISFCCVSVLQTLKLPPPGDTQITTERGRDVGNQQKRNAFKTIFTGLLIILFSYIPRATVGLISMLIVDEELFNCDIVPIVSSFNILGVMITPLLKIHKNAHLKCSNYQR